MKYFTLTILFLAANCLQGQELRLSNGKTGKTFSPATFYEMEFTRESREEPYGEWTVVSGMVHHLGKDSISLWLSSYQKKLKNDSTEINTHWLSTTQPRLESFALDDLHLLRKYRSKKTHKNRHGLLRVGRLLYSSGTVTLLQSLFWEDGNTRAILSSSAFAQWGLSAIFVTLARSKKHRFKESKNPWKIVEPGK